MPLAGPLAIKSKGRRKNEVYDTFAQSQYLKKKRQDSKT